MSAVTQWWRLLCLAYGHKGWPKIYYVSAGPRVVHYSFVIPFVGRIDVMAPGDLEIGPAWTAPDFRRRGLFQATIRQVASDLHMEGRTFWMLCRAGNTASARAMERAGLTLTSELIRKRRGFLIGHRYLRVRSAAGSASASASRDRRVQ